MNKKGTRMLNLFAAICFCISFGVSASPQKKVSTIEQNDALKIVSKEQAIEILYQALDKSANQETEYDIDTLLLYGRETLFNFGGLKWKLPKVFIEENKMYVQTWTSDGGDDCLEEFLATFSQLNELNISLNKSGLSYSTGQNPTKCRIRIGTEGNKNLVLFNSSGTMGSNNGPKVNYVEIDVINQRGEAWNSR